MTRLDEIRKRHAAASENPDAHPGPCEDTPPFSDAEFIAHSWGDVRWMIEQMEALQKALRDVLDDDKPSVQLDARRALERSKK